MSAFRWRRLSKGSTPFYGVGPIIIGMLSHRTHLVVSTPEQLWRMVRRRHQNKSKAWLFKKYWSASGNKHIFSFVSKYKNKTRILQIIRVSAIGIKRHIKIKADANPYDPKDGEYFWRRRNVKEARLLGALSHRQYQVMMAAAR